MHSTVQRIVLALALVSVTLLAAGCGKRQNYNNGYGNAFVTYTDSNGDFTSYKVIVTSMTLKRSDGTVVSGVSAAETVDFAKLSDISEMVSSTSVPVGTYTSATIALDYTNAAVFVNVNGVPTATKVVGGTGAALTTVSVVVTFDPANPLVIAQSGAQRLNMDFNLAASNRINLTTSPITVTATPFVTVDNNPSTTKAIRIRGPLVSYNSLQGTYTVYVRPFLDEANSLGSLTLFSTPTTSYVIDNFGFIGADGITAVTNLGTGNITSAYTTYAPDASAGTFTLTQAYIGTAVESGTADRIEGTVVARTGDTLTLRGATLSLRVGGFTYYPADATVKLAAATVVSIDGKPTATGVDKQDVSVGQQIIALGQSKVTSGVVALDASAGRVRVVPSRVWGTVLAGGVGTATLDLLGINEWPASAFNFAGTGATQISDIANYKLSTDAVDNVTLVGLYAAGTGFVTAFGAAPPDFTAGGLAAAATLDSRLQVEFINGGSKTPFATVSSTSVIIDLADPNLGTLHALNLGPQSTDLTTLPASPTIVASTTGRSSFAIGSAAAGIKVFSKFADFVTELNTTTTAAKSIARVVANGRYDATTNTLTASAISVVLQ